MRRSLVALLSVFVMSSGATAEQRESDFSIRLRGIMVGSFHLSTRETADSYSADAMIEDAGLMAVFRSFRYRGAARGRMDAGRPRPLHFEEKADTGRRTSEAVLTYEGGVPVVQSYSSSNPPGPDAPVPATQGDTVDPVTALFALFRDTAPVAACDTTLRMYDGMRRSEVVLFKAKTVGSALQCRGEYRRLQGFTPKELSRHVSFPLVITLQPTGDGDVQVTRVEIASSYGLVTLDRR